MSTILFFSPPLLFQTCYSYVSDILCFLSLSLSIIHGFRLCFIRAGASPEIMPHAYNIPMFICLISTRFRNPSCLSFFNSFFLFSREEARLSKSWWTQCPSFCAGKPITFFIFILHTITYYYCSWWWWLPRSPFPYFIASCYSQWKRREQLLVTTVDVLAIVKKRERGEDWRNDH